jgi:hypothetical protein
MAERNVFRAPENAKVKLAWQTIFPADLYRGQAYFILGGESLLCRV